MDQRRTCPLTTGQIIDQYFIENRTRLLELAAYLDRLDRSADEAPAAADFRMQSFQRALDVLKSAEPDKIAQIQLIFSDPTTEPKARLDNKSAAGVWKAVSGAQ